MMDNQTNSRKNYIIAGFGNPLLDIYVAIHDNTLLDKFNLLPDGQKEVDEIELKAILNCLFRDENELLYYAGGSAQNTLRIIQHLVKTPSFTVFFGGCGRDKQSEILFAQVKHSCVETRYAIQEKKPTGTAISLINGQNRSLIAHLGAANVYTLDNLQDQDNIEIIKHVNFVYIEGFFVSHSFNVALEVVKISRKYGNTIVFNLSGAYLFANYSSELATMVAMADIVVGNRSEFLALAKFLKIQESSIEQILLIVKSLDYEEYLPNSEDFAKTKFYKFNRMLNLEKIVICTNEENPVVAIYQNSKFLKVIVPNLETSLIKDTTGAGDAFVAGFIVGFIMKNTLNNCLEMGIKTAQKVIQSVGCSFPDDS